MKPLIDFLRLNALWLAAGFLLTFTSSFGQTFFISIFAGEIRQTFGLSHGQWGGIYTLATTASATVMVFAGGLTDRYRVRHIGVAILLGLALAAFAMSQITAVWALIVTIFFLRLLGQGMMGHAAMVAMGRWFLASRGRAISVAGLGVAMGEALLPISFVALMGVFDWRMLWVAATLILLALSPVLYRLLRQERTPQSFAEDTSALGMESRNWTRNEVFRHWLFWLMVPAIMGPAAWNTAFFFHQVHFAETKGWAHVSLVALFPLFTVTSVCALLLAGWAVDRFGSGRIAPFYLVPVALGFTILGGTGSLAAAAVAMVFMGASVGVHATLSGTLWAEFFGTRHLGSIRAMTAAVMVFGTAIGPGISGVLIDLGLEFQHQLYGIAVYFLVAAVLAGTGARRAMTVMAAQRPVAGDSRV